jgi:hypothetical protein
MSSEPGKARRAMRTPNQKKKRCRGPRPGSGGFWAGRREESRERAPVPRRGIRPASVTEATPPGPPSLDRQGPDLCGP